MKQVSHTEISNPVRSVLGAEVRLRRGAGHRAEETESWEVEEKDVTSNCQSLYGEGSSGVSKGIWGYMAQVL